MLLDINELFIFLLWHVNVLCFLWIYVMVPPTPSLGVPNWQNRHLQDIILKHDYINWTWKKPISLLYLKFIERLRCSSNYLMQIYIILRTYHKIYGHFVKDYLICLKKIQYWPKISIICQFCCLTHHIGSPTTNSF